MKREESTPKTITLPDDLSPEAALALHDVLRQITETVWELYKPQLISLILDNFLPTTSIPGEFDDDPPF